MSLQLLKISRRLASCVGVLIFSINAQGLTQNDTIRISGGKIQGYHDGDFTVFRGIPFARPPIKEHRFVGPQPVNWEGTLETKEFENSCARSDLKSSFTDFSKNRSEDCLYLNVTTPKKRGLFERQPVMVWVHGGSWEEGSGNENAPDLSILAGRGDLTVVSINHRLGAFGLTWLEQLNNTEDGVVKGNYAMRDTIQALEWVRDNIAKFGGDPNNVTIFGESAGGWSMCNLIASPMAAGLFDKAIMQSGTCLSVSPEEAQTDNDRFLINIGCNLHSDYAIRHCLQNKTVQEIKIATDASPQPLLGKFQHLSVIDGHFLPEHPLRMMELSLHNDVPVIIGNTREEAPALFFLAQNNKADWNAEINRVFKNSNDQDNVKAYYNPKTFNSYMAALAKLEIDLGHRCHSQKVAKTLLEYGSQDTFVYEFDLPVDFLPSAHGTDVGYLFYKPTQFPLSLVPFSGWLQRNMLDRWTQFAKTGTPNSPFWFGEPVWEAFNHSLPVYELNPPLAQREDAGYEGCEILDATSLETGASRYVGNLRYRNMGRGEGY